MNFRTSKFIGPIVFCLIAGTADLNRARAQGLSGLGDLPGGGSRSFAFGVSDDGSVVVGQAASSNGFEAFRWTSGGGMVGLGDLPGGFFRSSALGVSANGSVVVGQSRSASGYEAFRWTSGGGMVGLGDLPGGSYYSSALAVSADGSVVIGEGRSAHGPEAFRWTSGGGMVGLGDLPGGFFGSTAYGVSSDGSIVVGFGTSAHGHEAFRWTSGGGMVGLGDLPGGAFLSYAYGVSADGSVVVGEGISANGTEAFRWTSGGGMIGLGDLPGGSFVSIAYGVNADGTVVVGQGNSTSGFEAFYWTTSDGMKSLAQVLSDDGVSVAGIKLASARAVSDDGLVVVGEGYFGSGIEAFIARLAAPDKGAPTGLITLTELGNSISQMSVVIEGANTGNFFGLGSLAMVGTNFNFASLGSQPATSPFQPPSGLGARSRDSDSYGGGAAETFARQPGQGFGFVMGSLFGQTEDEFDARRGSGVTGLAVNLFSDITIGAGVMVSSSNADLPSRGSYHLRSLGGSAFISYRPRGTGLQFVAAGLARQLDLEVDRGYLNGASPDFSHGETDGTAWGGLIRIGYQLPFIAASTVTPFAEFAIAHSEFDAYAETGGAFPVSFNESSQTNRRVRVGAEVRAPLTSDIEGWAWLAWNHRLDSYAAQVAGQVQGLFAFDLPGTEFSGNGGDGGVGATWQFAPGMEMLASVGASFGSDVEPEINGRLGASIQLGSLF
ncbi:MAG: autotransporter domain-containing protein [Alphaproteobacteria bacterium]|nr:autotransporter domain-containing protein [Alphaproteobacteria bacterium]